MELEDYYIIRMDIVSNDFTTILMGFYSTWVLYRPEYFYKLRQHNSRHFQALLF